MRSRGGKGGLVLIILIAILLGGGYTAYAANDAYQRLDRGRAELVSGQAEFSSGERSGQSSALRQAAARMQQAEQDFQAAKQRLQTDPALQIAARLPAGGEQLVGTARLAAIGADLSRAGEAAAVIATDVAGIKERYAGKRITADDLQAILREAETITARYKESIAAIGQELKAAHAERAQVTTTNLVEPLRDAYDQVDRALNQADSAFVRYQDVRALLADLFGSAPSG